jgi:hypothetical protein
MVFMKATVLWVVGIISSRSISWIREEGLTIAMERTAFSRSDGWVEGGELDLD